MYDITLKLQTNNTFLGCFGTCSILSILQSSKIEILLLAIQAPGLSLDTKANNMTCSGKDFSFPFFLCLTYQATLFCAGQR